MRQRNDNSNATQSLTRRQFIKAAGAGAAVTGLSLGAPALARYNPYQGPKAGVDHSPVRGFVTSTGKNFILNGQPFYYAGTNCYYLHYSSHFMIDDVLNSASQMNLKVIRMWGWIDGAPKNGLVLQPEPYVYNERDFERLDYTVWRAEQLGIRLVIAFTDYFGAFGGMQQYVKWFNASGVDAFYTDKAIQKCYRAYIQHFLERRNRYNGVKYKDNPAVMTWELANEPRDRSDKSGDTLVHWADETSTYVKSLDQKHMVSVGDEGFYNRPGNEGGYGYHGYDGVDWDRLIKLPNTDYGTFHMYPDDWGHDYNWTVGWIKDHIHDAHNASVRNSHRTGKPVVLEEFGWRDLNTRDKIYRAWTNLVYKQGGNADQFWLLTGRVNDGTLYKNYDGYRVYYPSRTANVFKKHAHKMNQKSAHYQTKAKSNQD